MHIIYKISLILLYFIGYYIAVYMQNIISIGTSITCLLIGYCMQKFIQRYFAHILLYKKQITTWFLNCALISLTASLNLNNLHVITFGNIIIIIINIIIIFLIVFIIGAKIYKLSPYSMAYLAIGNAICGSAAIITLSGILPHSKSESTIPLIITSVTSSILLLLLPFLISISSFSLRDGAILIGTTIQSLAHVLAAASSLTAHSNEIASIIKIVRILFLFPVCIILFFGLQFSNKTMKKKTTYSIKNILSYIPWNIIVSITLLIYNYIGMPQSLESIFASIHKISLGGTLIGIGISLQLSFSQIAAKKMIFLQILITSITIGITSILLLFTNI